MAQSEADIGYGVAIAVSRDSGANWLAAGEVTNLTPPSLAVDKIEVTHSASPGGREFIPGIKSIGDISLDLNFVPGSDADELWQDLWADREVVTFRITYPEGAVWTLLAFLTSYTPASPITDKKTATVTLAARTSEITVA